MYKPFQERAKRKLEKLKAKDIKVIPSSTCTTTTTPKVFGAPIDRESDGIPIVISRVVEYFNITGNILPKKTKKEKLSLVFSVLMRYYCSFLLGVEVEGLFRISAQQSVIKTLIEQFDTGMYILFNHLNEDTGFLFFFFLYRR